MGPEGTIPELELGGKWVFEEPQTIKTQLQMISKFELGGEWVLVHFFYSCHFLCLTK